MSINTIAIATRLRETEIPAAQAEAIAEEIGTSLNEGTASKSDIIQMQTEIKASFATLEQRLEALEQRLTAKIEASRSSTLTWIVSVILAGAGLLLAISEAGMKPRRGWREQIDFALRSAREINPMNDWLLARMVASTFIIGVGTIILIKL